MLRRTLLSAALLALIPPVVLPTGAVAQTRTVSLAVTDATGLEAVQRSFGPFRDALQEATGYKINFFPVPSRTGAIEAVNAGKLDFVLAGPAEYVIMRKRTRALPILTLTRPDFHTVIFAIDGRGINSVADLKGRKLSVGDAGAVSQHLGAIQILADSGIDPKTDLQVIHLSRNIALEALKRGDTAAAAMNHLNLEVIKERDPVTKFRVIARGQDFPGDVLMAAPHLDREVVEKVRQGTLSHDKAIIAGLISPPEHRKYHGMAILPEVRDSDYDYVRLMHRTAGYPEFGEILDQ